MNGDIVRLTLRQLVGKRRTVFMVLVALLPSVLATAFRASGEGDPAEWASTQLLGGMVVAMLLPLAGLVFGTAILGTEIDDGTAVYLLARPIPRREILLSKLCVAWLLTAVFVAASLLVAGTIALEGTDEWGALIAGFVVATVAGSLAYCTVFTLLSLLTGRAFIAGLLYVFIWEGLVTALFDGTRLLSLRHATLGLAGYVASVSRDTFDPELGGATSVAVLILAVAAAGWLAVVKLQRFEIGESG
ncbi:MAG: ABC transporter permease [Dehalococcoidia bacterium]|nr:MAG: ABC transporter permease [bacterium]MCE7928882.1 ABC transporter permease [Chloroflexi bacterium CFX7]MCK6563832.1 ABC transporter permease [Dehalococcoidia bacterium]MCL4231884.1 ABC transporter permease [Dehalococcoidia bacterium]NUQ55601.1 ABC transporter permease [Dehalococcoidia bacterium]